MDAIVLVQAGLAGALVALTPGPAVLSFLAIGTARGRMAGARFLIGHLAGDLWWGLLALVTLAWAALLDPWVLRGLAVFCGGYLGWLGLRAVLARDAAEAHAALDTARPFVRGIVFGLTNPKSYPVTLAMFAALIGHVLGDLTPGQGARILAAMMGGFAVADVAMVWLVGTPPLRALYDRRRLWVVRATGLLFLLFAVDALRLAWER